METEGRNRAERRLAAILAADVASYSRLVGADEEGTLAQLRAIRAELIDPKIASHRGRLDLAFDDLGEQSLKNIARPIRAYRIGLPVSGRHAGETPVLPPPTLSPPDKPSIAVLPFQNMSGDPEQEYFVDGMVEEIITA